MYASWILNVNLADDQLNLIAAANIVIVIKIRLTVWSPRMQRQILEPNIVGLEMEPLAAAAGGS